MKAFLPKVLIVLMLVVPLAAQRGGGGGGGGGGVVTPLQDPTPFEAFVKKLKLDDKDQLPEVQRIFGAAAAQAAAISREMVRLRVQMVVLDAKPGERDAVVTAYAEQAAKMASLEVKAFQQVYALLEDKQKSKSAEAFVLMAGLFHPPLPRAPRMPGRGGGQ